MFAVAPVFLTLACASNIGDSVATNRGGDLVPRCQLEEISRAPVRLGDRHRVYIEPITVGANADGEILLAGERNYTFRRGNDDVWTQGSDSIIGVVIDERSEPRLIPSPIPTRELIGVRAASRTEGGWHVVFGETPPYEHDSRPASAQRLWYGIFDQGHWRELQRIEMPAGSSIDASRASRLVAYSKHLSWALPVRMPGSGAGVIIFSHEGSDWTFEIIPTSLVNYLDLTHSEGEGLLLATVQPDRQQRSDGNSLFMWHRQQSWIPREKLISGTAETVHSPQFGASGAALGWEATAPSGEHESTHLRALTDLARSSTSDPITLDTALGQSTTAPLQLREGGHLWVVESLHPNPVHSSIRILYASSEQTKVIGEYPNPFDARFNATLTAAQQVIVSGAVVDSVNQTVESLIVRSYLQCERASRS